MVWFEKRTLGFFGVLLIPSRALALLVAFMAVSKGAVAIYSGCIIVAGRGVAVLGQHGTVGSGTKNLENL